MQKLIGFIKKNDYLAAFLFFALLLIIVFSPVIFGRQTFFSAIGGLSLESGPYSFDELRTPWTLDPGAYMHTDVPQTIFWYKSLQSGIFPFWNPYQGLGVPLSGDILAAAYNPFKLVFFYFFPYLKTFDFFIIFKLLVAGFGVFLLLKNYGLSQRASLLGGSAYMFSGYFIQWLTHWSLTAEMMTPYILLAIEYFFKSASFKSVLFVIVSFSLMVLSAVPEGVAVITIFVFLYFIFKLIQQDKNHANYLLKFALALFIAFLILVPMLWDIFLFFSQSIDAHGTMTANLDFSLKIFPEKIVRVLQIFITPSLFLEAARLGGMYQNNFVLPYFGIFTLLLVLAAVTSIKRSKNNAVSIFFTAYTVFFLLLLAGIPPISWLEQLPFLSKLIFLKYSGTLYFSIAVLAAFGFSLVENNAVDKKRFCRALLVLGAVLLVSFLFFSSFRQSYALRIDAGFLPQIDAQLEKMPKVFGEAAFYFINKPYAYVYAILAIHILLIALFLWLLKKKKISLIFIVLILELVIYIPKIRDGGFKPFNPFKEAPFVSFLKTMPDIEEYRIFATGKTLKPYVATAYGLRDFRTYNSLYLKQYVEFVRPVLGEKAMDRIIKCWCILFDAEEIDGRFAPLFDKAGVKYIISEKPIADASHYQLIYDAEVKIYENSSALPIVYIKTGDIILKTAEIVASKPNEIKIQFSSPAGGSLVYGDIFYPGWRATIDGKEAPIYAADNLFKQVPIVPGEHYVIFSYNPFSPALERIKKLIF